MNSCSVSDDSEVKLYLQIQSYNHCIRSFYMLISIHIDAVCDIFCKLKHKHL